LNENQSLCRFSNSPGGRVLLLLSWYCET
jgi:hypothetical protein